MAGGKGVTRRNFMRLASAASAGLVFDWDGLTALAAKIGPKRAYPVVVIGAGLGGLTAAAVLARRGFPVTLVEQHDRPGGYATSFDRAAGRFNFEVSLHATGSIQGGPIKEALEKAGILAGMEMADPPELCRIVTPDHDLTWPQRKPEAVIRSLTELFPREKESIESFFRHILSILDEAMKPVGQDSWMDKILFPVTHRKMWAIRNKTLAQVLDQARTKEPRLRTILANFWGYFGLPPSKLSGFLYSIAVASYLRYGGYYIKDRSQDLSYALTDVVEKAGGEVRLETRVKEILTEKGRVKGVGLETGERLPAGIVVSNASAPSTLEMVLKNDPSLTKNKKIRAYLEKLGGFSPSISTFLVWLGLNKELRGKIKGYEIFMERGYDPEESYRAALACDPLKAGLGVTIYDNVYEGYSKPGTSTVTLLMLSGYEPWKKYEADYEAGNKEAYRREKERIARIMIRTAEERVIPGLSSMVEVMETASPLTNRRFTGNPGGAIYGFEQTLETTYMNRVGTGTTIRGLYLSSAWSHGGGFQPTLGAGPDAARRIIKDLGMDVENASAKVREERV